MRCFVCGKEVQGGYGDLGQHFSDLAADSDPDHVMWMNRNLTKRKLPARELGRLLEEYERGEDNLSGWAKRTFIDRFLGPKPHPFVVAMQRPAPPVLIGYVLEHQHFLRQWVRSCASVIAKTDKMDVSLYEIDNITTEFGGWGSDRPSHYELLLRMGESLGLRREDILSMAPLEGTKEALKTWGEIARDSHWVGIMGAMHTLELIANRRVKEDGASITYFDPSIFHREDVPQAVKEFLREGYEADVGHSEEALALVDKYAKETGLVAEVREALKRSMDAFDIYLQARLERAREYESA